MQRELERNLSTMSPSSEKPANSSGLGLLNIQDNPDEKQLVAYANALYGHARRARLQFERDWFLNLCFYFGRQYVQWHSTAAGEFTKLSTPPAPHWRVRLVSNKIRPIIRKEIAKITKEQPQFFVVPASTDEEDLAAAKAGEAVFEHLVRELKLNKVMRRAMFWTATTGNGFVKIYWDPNKKTSSSEELGSICFEHVTPFHLFVPDVQTEDLENQPYVIHTMAKDPDWVSQTYNKDGVIPDMAGGSDLIEQKFLSAIGVQAQPKSTVSVKEMWLKPNKKFPNGAVITWAGDQLLSFSKEWPYLHHQYPFAKIDHIPTGRFYYDSVIPDLIPLQKEYNRTRSQIIEAKNRMSKPQLIAPRGSVDARKITSEPGLVIYYTPGYTPPTPLPLQNLPSYVLQEVDRCQKDMDDISSQHEITQGRTPPGVSAATAISYLQEEDDSVLMGTVSSVEECVEKIGRQCLSLVQQFWTTEHKIKIVGDNNDFEALVFTAQSLKGNTDLVVQAGSATPRSRAAKQAFLMEIGKMGWLPPDKILKYLDMAETGRLYDELQIDARQARRENLKMAKLWKSYLVPSGEPDPNNPDAGVEVVGAFPVNTWDNHEAHIEEHNKFRKSQEFEKLPEEAQQVFESHVQMHQQMLAMSMGAMIPPGQPTPAMGAAPLGIGGPMGSMGQPDSAPPGASQGAEGLPTGNA